MDKFREFLGAIAIYAAMFIGVMAANWAARFELQNGLDSQMLWLIPLAIAVFGWGLAAAMWKAMIELGLPRAVIRWPRWAIIPVPVLILFTIAIYGVVVFLPAISRREMLWALAVIPLIPAGQMAYRRLRREFDEDFEAE
ncbi:hypothetical protein [Hyphobacterium marinum]|uniref:Uncharacterized protein n=1 Tax=Hyphobacterium marinum TaxID=3116574 RepID=A0ABU7M0J0_9PROT|nr:hypothetical protein [Hyphobacterium sp. Y6023]MEE2567329.1 hypothetical protein [Hyphobacterium sp. Y6023]